MRSGGDGVGFWDYGYPDIYAGVFAPYGFDDLSGYLAQRPSGRRHRGTMPLAQMCGDDSRAIAGLPIDQIQLAVQPTEAQFAALDDLGNASIAAAQNIRAACPAQIVLTAPGRLAAMQQRIEAMVSAVATVQPPLEKFYGLLNDEQKARFNALAEDQRKLVRAANNAKDSLAQGCGSAYTACRLAWPAREIEARLHPNDTQRATLQVLQDTSAEAAETLKAACQASDAMTPPTRLAAIGKRLDTMLQATKQVRAALEDFTPPSAMSKRRSSRRSDQGDRRSQIRRSSRPGRKDHARQRTGLRGISGRLLPEYHRTDFGMKMPRSDDAGSPRCLATVADSMRSFLKDVAMRWFNKTKQTEVWDEAIEWPIGDIEAAHKIREICRSAADSAEKIAGAADRSHQKISGEVERYERAAKVAMEIAIKISDDLLRDAAVRQIVGTLPEGQ